MEFLIIKKDRLLLPLMAVVSLIFGLFLLQDLIKAVLKDYNFYLSEAALFNGFWLLFLPGILFSRWLHQRLTSGNSSNYFRMVLILTVTSALHLTLFVIWVHGGSWLFLNHVYALKWTLRYALAEHLFLAVIGYAFVALVGVVREKRMLAGNEIIPKPLPVFAKRLAVKANLQTIYLDIEKISCLLAESPYVAIHTRERKYLEDTTLKALTSQLPPGRFVRIHRSCIVNLSWVSSSASRGNGDYDISFSDGSCHRLSRNYAAEYKLRMVAHQRVNNKLQEPM